MLKAWIAAVLLFGLWVGAGVPARAQENPLGQVETPTPVKSSAKTDTATADGASSTATRKADSSGQVPGTVRMPVSGLPRLRMEANLVLVPMTVTDPRNRLVTGLEAVNFQVFDNNVGQSIKSFSTDDAPVSIGVIFDLSGSMQNKFARARKALTEFLRTSNPADEFFVVGFNDRPAVVVDYTSDVDDVEARMVMLRPENRTALIDAVYLGVDKLKQAKYDRKALLVISDGGDNRSRYTEGELRRVIRESDVQIFAMGIFDDYAPTEEEQLGPVLLSEMAEATGGQMFKVTNLDEMSDIATRISAELRNEYVVGYRPSDMKKDGNWRKLKVRLVPPPGLPALTVHFRQGYYAASQ